MLRFDARRGSRYAAAAASLAVLAASPVPAQNNLTPGDVAIIGWIDNGSPQDAFALVALADLPAGTAIYFTDNGWDSVSGGFRNTNGPADGNGNEALMALTVQSAIPAGTILDTTQTSAAFTWTTSGAIPGATSGTYGFLVLSQSGDQVYAFQQDSGQNPMNTGIRQHLFVLDDTGTFEDATSTTEGGVPPGLSPAGNTALTFPQTGSSLTFMGFNTSALASGSKDGWLAAIHDPANWTFGSAGTLPSGSINVTPPAITPFCYADGSLPTACPCGNQGSAGRGCDNSAHTGGAQLTANGTTNPDTIVLTTSGQNPSTSTFFLQASVQFPNGISYGDGVRCIGGAFRKIGSRQAQSGSASFPGPAGPSISAISAQNGDPLSSGMVRYYQVLYRDRDTTFCPNPPGNAWNVTSAVRIVW